MKVDWQLAPDIKKRINHIIKTIGFPHIKPGQIITFRSYGSKARAYARIWSLPVIWQKALQVKPHYCIEVLSHRFDKLSKIDQTKTLIHELLHIPKTFSGALLPHRGRGNIKVDSKTVNKYFRKYLQATKI